MSTTVGQAQDAIVAQQAVIAAAYANWQVQVAALAPLQQALKQLMVNAGIPEGSQNDPRPFASR